MEILENIYAVLVYVLIPLLVLAVLVAAFLPKEKRKALLQRLCRLQF